MCDVLGYSRQAYYKQLKRQALWLVKRQAILDSIHEVRKDLPMTGTVKLVQHLQGQWATNGIKVGRDKTNSILREEGMLLRRRKRNKPQTTWSKHWLKKHPNLIKGKRFERSNQLWVSDITYISVNSKWMYLFLITDAVSHRVVGYHLSRGMDTSAGIKALEMAITNEGIQKHNANGLIHHSDRGIQYCSKRYVKYLKSEGIRISMTQTGSPYDNAVAERINGILKHELIYPFGAINSFSEAYERVDRAIYKYNHLRLHQNNNYITPNNKHQELSTPKRINVNL